ncbi:hypothetical protein BDN72DRAFT_905242 [Pluteus cervinus]|uniref:Uncharacterized protein n=1 Tax=Pluteus cervinus TaxID=181527 RepID=A0ACD3A3B3_9AGAR|nr:hypothetical protein BDN72DRAFT_905242 [Pluteus cervinus]
MPYLIASPLHKRFGFDDGELHLPPPTLPIREHQHTTRGYLTTFPVDITPFTRSGPPPVNQSSPAQPAQHPVDCPRTPDLPIASLLPGLRKQL